MFRNQKCCPFDRVLSTRFLDTERFFRLVSKKSTYCIKLYVCTFFGHQTKKTFAVQKTYVLFLDTKRKKRSVSKKRTYCFLPNMFAQLFGDRFDILYSNSIVQVLYNYDV